MSTAQDFRCSNAARERGDAIAGTAPRGRVWILIEYRGGWPRNGFDGVDIDWRVRAGVAEAAERHGARILLMRRPGRRTVTHGGQWAVLRLDAPGDLRQTWGGWSQDADLLRICDALDARGESPTTPAELPPVVLVCTHGQHDVCCALRGRPVAAALAERWPELIWECSHVGGDRFAANIVVVPDGVYYGNLDVESALGVISDHLDNRIGGTYLRGYTDLRPVEQVAVAAVLDAAGPAGRFDYDIDAVSRAGADWTIGVSHRREAMGAFEVSITQSRSAPTKLTCHGIDQEVANIYTVNAIIGPLEQPGK